MRPTVCFDFDGVIHSYTSGWKGADVIPDPPVSGIRMALKSFKDNGYTVYVCTTRCETIKGRNAVMRYLHEHVLMQYVDFVTGSKPPAIAYIDDRAIQFDGHPENLLQQVENLTPWYEKNK